MEKSLRCLDIGPGNNPAKGFETLDALPGPLVNHVGRAEKPPFPKNTFDIVHASHVLEHIHWLDVEGTIKQWVNILKPGGVLEIWVPNGYKLMQALLILEETNEWVGPDNLANIYGSKYTHGDPYKWAMLRLLNYPKKGKYGHFWEHKSIFTPKYLKRILSEAGLNGVRDLEVSEIRGKKHFWINYGACGVKP